MPFLSVCSTSPTSIHPLDCRDSSISYLSILTLALFVLPPRNNLLDAYMAALVSFVWFQLKYSPLTETVLDNLCSFDNQNWWTNKPNMQWLKHNMILFHFHWTVQTNLVGCSQGRSLCSTLSFRDPGWHELCHF